MEKMTETLKMEVDEIEAGYFPIKTEHSSNDPDLNVKREHADPPETIKSEVHKYDSPDFVHHPNCLPSCAILDYQSYQDCMKTEQHQLENATNNFKTLELFPFKSNEETSNSVPQARNSLSTVELVVQLENDKIRLPLCRELISHPDMQGSNTSETAKKPDDYIDNSEEILYNCDNDGEADSAQHQPKNHSNTNIENKVNKHCETCGQTFAYVSGLKRHMLTHTGEKPHGCSTCGQTFTRVSGLNRHMLSHTGEKPHICSTCGQTFTRHSGLKGHMLTHTGEKPRGCTTCRKTFAHESGLRSHMLTHTGEKPHECSTCGKTFVNMSNLRRHISTHTGEKPHKCPTCGNTFSQMTTLRRHISTHTGKKSHTCSTCGQMFARMPSLQRHILKHS